MLFNSPEFIFFFLPITLFGFLLIRRFEPVSRYQPSIFWLVAASLFFYGWWNPANLVLILTSVVLNYSLGYFLSRETISTHARKGLLILGIGLNLALIGYFKYAHFFANNFNELVGANIKLPPIILPLAISFFTFQQIAYLVDAYRGETKEYNFLNYSLFVTFFPQLIAGPIVHHKDVLPQVETQSSTRITQRTIAIGLTIFVAGLFKKIVFADRIAAFATPVFAAAAQGVPLTFSEAWAGALAYTLQLYFDFSGYSDMAIGAAYLFGIRLPLNFDSPYKAHSIIDFWRRWHITLSHFLRDYLYIPLGGNRNGKTRQYLNLLITMLLGGLWHGAGWTFVFWGGLHGFYLVINHLYRGLRQKLGSDFNPDHSFLWGMGWFVTFLAVVVSWVFFRADSFESAQVILGAMAGMNGISLPQFWETYLGFLRAWGVAFSGFSVNVGLSQKYAVIGISALLAVAWFTPNTQQWMGQYSPTLTQPQESSSFAQHLWRPWQWKPSPTWSAVLGCLTAISILGMTRVSEFLYFQF